MNLNYFEELMILRYPDEPVPPYFKSIEQVLGFIDDDIEKLKGGPMPHKDKPKREKKKPKKKKR